MSEPVMIERKKERKKERKRERDIYIAGCFILTVFLMPVIVIVLWLFLEVPLVGLQCVIVVFAGSIVRPANRDWACQTERCHTLSKLTSLQ